MQPTFVGRSRVLRRPSKSSFRSAPQPTSYLCSLTSSPPARAFPFSSERCALWGGPCGAHLPHGPLPFDFLALHRRGGEGWPGRRSACACTFPRQSLLESRVGAIAILSPHGCETRAQASGVKQDRSEMSTLGRSSCRENIIKQCIHGLHCSGGRAWYYYPISLQYLGRAWYR